MLLLMVENKYFENKRWIVMSDWNTHILIQRAQKQRDNETWEEFVGSTKNSSFTCSTKCKCPIVLSMI